VSRSSCGARGRGAAVLFQKAVSPRARSVVRGRSKAVGRACPVLIELIIKVLRCVSAHPRPNLRARGSESTGDR